MHFIHVIKYKSRPRQWWRGIRKVLSPSQPPQRHRSSKERCARIKITLFLLLLLFSLPMTRLYERRHNSLGCVHKSSVASGGYRATICFTSSVSRSHSDFLFLSVNPISSLSQFSLPFLYRDFGFRYCLLSPIRSITPHYQIISYMKREKQRKQEKRAIGVFAQLINSIDKVTASKLMIMLQCIYACIAYICVCL